MASLQICENDVLHRFAPYVTLDPHDSVAKILFNLSLKKNTTLLICKWNNRFYIPQDLLTYVLTDEGICFQFNGLHPEDIYRDPRQLVIELVYSGHTC